MAYYEEEGEEAEHLSDTELTQGEEDPNQACFVLHHGGAKNAAAASSIHSNSPPNTARISRKQHREKKDLFTLPPCLPEEPAECGAWRLEAFETIWSEIEKNVQDALQDQITSSFQDIRRFIVDTQFCDAQLKLHLSAKASNDPYSLGSSAALSKQLHTALVSLCNVDSSDHKNTFKDLALFLKQHDCHVASLLPHNFSNTAGVGCPLQSVFKQIVDTDIDTTDMDILISWHKEPRKRKHPLVIIIEDVERCQSTVLADLIVLLSEWVTELPLILIMGMATCGETLRKMLPASAMRCLHVQKFTMQSPTKYLESVMNAAFVGDYFGFLLGRDVIKLLLNFFNSHDNTIAFFLRALKMACMEHFYSQPLSFLCKNLKQQLCQVEFEEICASLPDVLLNYAATLPSVKRHLGKNTKLSKNLAASLYQLNLQMKNWCQVLQCLVEAGKQVEVDCTEIFRGICQLEPVDTLSKVPNHTAFHEALKVYGNIMMKMRDLPILNLEKLVQKWEKLTGELENVKAGIKTLLSKFSSEEPLKSSNGDPFCLKACTGNSRRKKLMSLAFESQFIAQDSTPPLKIEASEENLLSSEHNRILERSMHHMSGLQATQPAHKSTSRLLSKMVVDLLEEMLRKYLLPVESFPFHEIICFKEVGALKQVLLAETRKRVHMDLLNSHCCLQQSTYEVKKDDNSLVMHDSCIMYCQAQKLGENVNIYDWYQSFITCISEVDAQEKKGHHSKKRKIKNESLDKVSIQARFCKAASELQLVGLLRLASKKRPDFVHLTI